MLLNEINPTPLLKEWVRLYRIIDFHFDDNVIIPPKLYSPRPEHCLQFYPRDTEKVFYTGGDKNISGRRVALIGQHTVVNQRFVGKDFLSIQIVFHPAALYRLCGISIQELTNKYMDAEDVFGSGVRFINEQLFAAGSYKEMIGIVEKFLLTFVRKIKREYHLVDQTIMRMIKEENSFSLDKYVKQSYLSHRQFDRKFTERAGMPPKQFLQVVRFDRAFRMKNRNPEKDWLSIALHCGYHDYQHLVRDYKSFTGYTPTRFFELDNLAPERAFGDAEV